MKVANANVPEKGYPASFLGPSLAEKRHDTGSAVKICVELRDACPSSAWTTYTASPRPTSCIATVWRKASAAAP